MIPDQESRESREYRRIIATLQAIIKRYPQKAATAQFLYDELVKEAAKETA